MGKNVLCRQKADSPSACATREDSRNGTEFPTHIGKFRRRNFPQPRPFASDCYRLAIMADDEPLFRRKKNGKRSPQRRTWSPYHVLAHVVAFRVWECSSIFTRLWRTSPWQRHNNKERKPGRTNERFVVCLRTFGPVAKQRMCFWGMMDRGSSRVRRRSGRARVGQMHSLVTACHAPRAATLFSLFTPQAGMATSPRSVWVLQSTAFGKNRMRRDGLGRPTRFLCGHCYDRLVFPPTKAQGGGTTVSR
jgi:hypothetical protein